MVKTGAAFGDYIRTERITRFRGDNFFTSQHTHMRGFFLLLCLAIVGCLFLFRLGFLQLAQGHYYRDLSDTNRIRTTTVHAPRGIIFDRHGKPLVFNIPGFRKKEGTETKLITREDALSRIAKGEQLEVDTLRQYPYSDAFSHVIGYIGQISQEELHSDIFKGYKSGDVVGKMGIEKQYESKLVGIDGKTLAEIDSQGRPVRTLGQTDPIPGQNITLTLDATLQKTAYAAMRDVRRGAVIVTTPKGEVLALVSKPGFDPNLFTLGQSYKAASDSAYHTVSDILLDGVDQPLLNRAISGVYPPGSTYKLITAATGLERHVVDRDFIVEDNGVITIGSFSFANWYFLEHGGTEGQVNMVRAIARSNDIYFYKLAEMIGVDSLAEMTRKFGVGQRLGIDLEGEAKGIVPDNAWKKKVIGEQWYLGDTYHYGIGQGYLLTTPLQVNAWTQAIANKGAYYVPHLIQAEQPSQLSEAFLADETLAVIREGMIESCSQGGVAWPLFDFKVKNEGLKIDGKNIVGIPEATSSANMSDYRHVSVACKTGTAQHGGEETLPHAWITLFAPAYNPQVIVTVLAESSGQGSSIAGPVAKAVLEDWFSR